MSVSLKRTLDQGREEYKAAAYAAPPSAEIAPISQDLSDAPMPFPKMQRPKAPAAERHVASEFIFISVHVRLMCGVSCAA